MHVIYGTPCSDQIDDVFWARCWVPCVMMCIWAGCNCCEQFFLEICVACLRGVYAVLKKNSTVQQDGVYLGRKRVAVVENVT